MMAAHDMNLDKLVLRRVLHSILRSLVWNKNDWAAEKRLAEDTRAPLAQILPAGTDQELVEIAVRFAGMFGCAGLAGALTPQMSCEEWLECLVAGGALGVADVTFHSSGSTGEPTACPQPLSVLWQEVGELGRLTQDRRRLVSVVPQHHIYGFLFSVLLPAQLGVPTELLPPFPGAGLSEFLREGDLLIAFPAFWKGLASLGLRFPTGVRGVTSTGPCPPQIIEQLRQQGLDAMMEVYGSSETSGVGYRWDQSDAYSLFRFWQPVALQQTSPDALIRHQLNGLMAEPVMLPDEVQWLDERTFRPLRRRDQAVQVAGINVYPQYVVSCLKQHPAVEDCVVRLMRPEEGDRLKAFVVPVDPRQADATLRSALIDWCRQRLKSVEQPRSFTFGTQLPTQGMGKLADW
ncbi:acyl-CoA synthetase, AMP-forming [Syntrophotalea carbinolica DSM 2380]|uniref:Acyl-CoA synthetase, AMP-forming n=2 Tax=Syntrophotalea carbinolica TaxID=19 RepID=Q3A173_SYNC1|nr:acyl-CoA synthetase, AMP-forming [Syntrophotalea carbinolica DSM 2380]